MVSNELIMLWAEEHEAHDWWENLDSLTKIALTKIVFGIGKYYWNLNIAEIRVLFQWKHSKQGEIVSTVKPLKNPVIKN